MPCTFEMSLVDVARESPFARPASRRNYKSPFGHTKHSREGLQPFVFRVKVKTHRSRNALRGVTRATRYRPGAHDRRANACSQRPAGE
jgi:hypothetical protein